jgi:hypothetical protein
MAAPANPRHRVRRGGATEKPLTCRAYTVHRFNAVNAQTSEMLRIFLMINYKIVKG